MLMFKLYIVISALLWLGITRRKLTIAEANIGPFAVIGLLLSAVMALYGIYAMLCIDVSPIFK